MRCKKLVALSTTITLSVLLSPPIYAKKIYPAEVMGRDLNVPGLGWIGHVGISNANIWSPQDMQQNAYLVTEILNEPVVGQINSISDFKKRSPYWGSRYGVADRGVIGYKILVEANQQRWWCPVYTSDTDYHIGSGIPTTGQVIECGRWRCDTFVWWAFYSQGFEVVIQKN